MDSGDFCSRKRPSNTAATWFMSKAQTAEPGMLPRRAETLLSQVGMKQHKPLHLPDTPRAFASAQFPPWLA